MRKNIIFIFLLCFACSTGDSTLIREQLDGMESAWRNGDKLGVAQFYSDDGYLISSGEIRANGRAEINAYWEGFSREPVDWILSDYITTKDPKEITDSGRYKPENLLAITTLDSIDFPIPNDAYYQLGRSDLIWQTNDVLDTGTVDFFLVWKKVDDTYRIFIDAYN